MDLDSLFCLSADQEAPWLLMPDVEEEERELVWGEIDWEASGGVESQDYEVGSDRCLFLTQPEQRILFLFTYCVRTPGEATALNPSCSVSVEEASPSPVLHIAIPCLCDLEFTPGEDKFST